MVSINKEDVIVPLDVPKAMRETYVKKLHGNHEGSGRLMLFAGDQKVEHLNDDFFLEQEFLKTMLTLNTFSGLRLSQK
ncbi:hypothetical protein [Methanosarcina horonobensis]|uniref:hypothetical protein n=1 Tax=Methanosarcina horonobensis TaxID=418008 RepID=UPI000AEE4F0E